MERRLPANWQDLWLSKHFMLREFVVTNDHPELLIDFIPDIYQVTNVSILTTLALQPARDRFGPINIHSGICPEALNEVLGRKKDTQHLYGEAADFSASETSSLVVYNWLREVLRWPGELLVSEKKAYIHVALPVLWVHPDIKIL